MWRSKVFRFRSLAESEVARRRLEVWIAENSHRFQIVEVFVQNAWAVEYRPYRCL